MRDGVTDQKFNWCNTKAFRENPLICAIQIKFMKSRLLVLFCIFFMILGCSKDGNQSKPSIKLVSYDAVVLPNSVFNAHFTFSQSGGSISGDSLFIIYHRYNRSLIPPDDDRGNFDTTLLAETPPASKAEFTVNLDWSFLSYGINDENDTIDLSFILTNLAGKRSDTVKTSKIIVVYQ
jgi:hypothetical protein